MKIIWCMIPEIWSTTDRIFFSFWTIFCPFTPPTPSDNPENQNFEKMKIAPGDIIILHKCTINDNHMIHGSWDMMCTRQNFFVILGHFFPFYPPYSLKNEKFKKMKKMPQYIIILHNCTKNHDHMLYCSWHMTGDRCNCYFWFWAIFCPFTPITAWKMKISK